MESEQSTPLTLLNTSVITSPGEYRYERLSVDKVKELVEKYVDSNRSIQSAIGHQATADVLTSLLGVSVPVNRMDYHQAKGERALVFKLLQRAPEGRILDRAEIEAIGYEFGLLTRLE